MSLAWYKKTEVNGKSHCVCQTVASEKWPADNTLQRGPGGFKQSIMGQTYRCEKCCVTHLQFIGWPPSMNLEGSLWDTYTHAQK